MVENISTGQFLHALQPCLSQLLVQNEKKCDNFNEGPEGVKWELGFAHFLAGKMGFHALGLGFINKKTIENGNWIKI